MSQGTKRTTSSRRHANVPILGSKAPRLRATRRSLKEVHDETWVIPLTSVESCAESRYDDGKGLKKIWSSEDPANIVTERFCTLRCHGNVQSLRLEIGLFKGKRSKFSRLLFDEVIEEGKNVSIGILAFEMTRRLRITCNKTGRVPSKTVWNLAFLLDTDRKVSLCKTSLKKLINVAANMPSSCISYRNFSNTAVNDEGSLTLERANRFNVTFTGFLATVAGRHLIGESREDDEPAIITRSGGATQKRTENVTRGTPEPEPEQEPDEEEEEEEMERTFAQRKAAKKRRKQANKQAKRNASPSRSTSVDDSKTENVQESPKAAPSKSAAVAESTSEEDAGAPAGDDDERDLETGLGMESLAGDRIHSDETQYLVRWKPSWQSANKVPPSLVKGYYAPAPSGVPPAVGNAAWGMESLAGDRVHNDETQYLVRRKPSWQSASKVPPWLVKEYYAPAPTAVPSAARSAARSAVPSAAPSTALSAAPSAAPAATLKRRRSARIQARSHGGDPGGRAA